MMNINPEHFLLVNFNPEAYILGVSADSIKRPEPGPRPLHGSSQSTSRVVAYKEGTVATSIIQFVWEPYPLERTRICYRCTLNPFPLKIHRCASCKWAHYCSEECQKADWNDHHKSVCKLVKQKDLRLGGFISTLAIMVHKIIIRLKADGPTSHFYNIPTANVRPEVANGKLGFKASEPNLRLIDPEGVVCPNQKAYDDILSRMGQKLIRVQAYLYQLDGTRYRGEDWVGMMMPCSSKWVACTCLPNVTASCPSVDTDIFDRINIVATRDIYEGEELSLHIRDFFCTKAQRLHCVRQDGVAACLCSACVDPSVEAARTTLKCQNDACSEAIPSDERAQSPCPACGTVLTSERLAEGRALIEKLNEFHCPPMHETLAKHIREGPIALIRSYIEQGEKLLHPTNILMGLLYRDACGYLAAQKQGGSVEWLAMAFKCIRPLELHAGKYSVHTRSLYTKIMLQLLQAGKVGPARIYARIAKERSMIHPGVGSITNDLFVQLCKDLARKPKPKIDAKLLRELKEDLETEFDRW